MGRWAQSRRSGGGEVELNYMVEAFLEDSTHIEVTYAWVLDPSGFTAADFATSNPAEVATEIEQVAPRAILLTFDQTISGATALTYDGLAPGIRNPQTIPTT